MAFTPSRPGILKSISVMSGRCFFQSSAACCPSPVSATTSMSTSCLIIATRPSRTTVWSSATRTRITSGFCAPAARFLCPGLETTDVSAARIFSRMLSSVVRFWLGWVIQNNLNLRALAWHGTQDELATHLVNAFFHSQQSKAFVFRVQVKSSTVVNKTELDLVRANDQSGSEVFRFRVFDRIRQRLLGNSQQALFPFWRHRRLVSFQMKFRLQATAIGHALEQIVQRHAQRCVLKRAWTQSHDGTTRLSQSDPRQVARPLNAVCRFGKIVLRNSTFRCFQLHDDTSESLRERIMNVARHAIAFCRDGRLAALL